MSELPKKDHYTVLEIRRHYNVAKSRVYEWIQTGEIVAKRLPPHGHYRITRDSVLEFDKRCQMRSIES